jgi:AcrR family transcriptional regulator
MSRKPHTAARDESKGVRERILAAATGILRESGIQALSQVQVARVADVRQSHITYYFPTRHDLIEAVAMRFVEHAYHAIATATAEAAPDDLVAAFQEAAVAIADEGHMRMFIGVLIEADSDAAMRAVLVRVTKQLQATLAEHIGGTDAMERARLVLASLWGLGLYDFLMRPKRRSPLTASLLAYLVVRRDR